MKPKNKTSPAKARRIYFGSLLSSFLIIGIIVSLHLVISEFNLYWVFFSLILILTPIYLIDFKTFIETKANLTNEQKKNVSLKVMAIVLWYWYLDFLYMTIFNNWKYAMYTMSVLAIIYIFYNVIFVFLKRKTKNGFYNVILISDFLIGIALTIYLIYSIDNEILQNIVTTIVAALFGGLVTLVGVAWTIKETNESKKKEDEQKAVPLFAFNMLRAEPRLSETVVRVCFPSELENDYKCEVYSKIENSNKNAFKLKRILHDGKWFDLEGNTTVLPSSFCILAFNFNEVDKPMVLEILDELSKKHYYCLQVLFLGNKSSSGKALHTIRGISDIDDDF